MSSIQVRNLPIVVIIIAMLGMIGPFTIDTIFPAFQQMGIAFEADSAAMQLVTSTYLFSFAAMSLVHGPISDAIGRKPVMIAGVLIFALASVGAALSPSLAWVLVFRAIQGLSAGAGQIISRALIRDMFEGAMAQRLMAQVSMIFAIAPAIAPIIGGWLLGFGAWPIIFWFLAGFGVLLAALVAFVLPETHPVENRTPLQLVPVVGSIFAIARNWSFTRLAFAATFGFAAQFTYIAGAPIFMVDLLGKGERDFWMLFVPMMSCMVLGSWTNARFAERVPGRRLATIGYLVAITAAVTNVVLAGVVPWLPWAIVGPSLVAFGVALSFPVVQLVMLDLFPAHRGAAASMQAFVTLAFNGLLAAVIVPLVDASTFTMALASVTFSAIGLTMWLWHRAAIPAEATAEPA